MEAIQAHVEQCQEKMVQEHARMQKLVIHSFHVCVPEFF